MSIRVCALKLWLLHVTALTLHPCFAQNIWEEIGTPVGGEFPLISMMLNGTDTVGWPATEDKFWTEFHKRRYFYVHNETQITMARTEAEARHHNGAGARSVGTTTMSSILGSPSSFPDSAASEDGCHLNSLSRDLSFYGSTDMWDMYGTIDVIEILAVDSCTSDRNVWFGDRYFELSSQRWVKPEKPDILIRDNPNPLTHSFKTFVRIQVGELEILADGVYSPATGAMHLVGCSREKHLPDFSSVYSNSTSTFVTRNDVPESAEAEISEISPEQGYWFDPERHHQPPLNSSTPKDCAISATVQYPPLNCRWNTDRVLKYSIRSNRATDDPLYFAPLEHSAFFPYVQRYFRDYSDNENLILSQRKLETGGRISLLALGLLCIALQIDHGSKNEESLPFVSLVMLGIQFAHHLSQTAIFKDLQIQKFYYNYRPHFDTRTGHWHDRDDFYFPDPISDLNYKYYETMAWSEHVPYQAMAMTAIFMYVWLIHKVGDTRRIMKLRMLRRRPGATDPPSDWKVMYRTLAIFSFVGFLGFFVIGADRYGHFRRALTGMTAEQEERLYYNPGNLTYNSNAPSYMEVPSPFVPWRFYEISYAQWGFVNKLTGLVVSFFLVPQLLGNMQWKFQGRPLSAWFYAGIPTLNLLPHVFSIAKHFQLLPIILRVYDPYINSIYGFFQDPTPWWQIGVVVCSTLQVLAVHSQFSRSRHPRPKSPEFVQRL